MEQSRVHAPELPDTLEWFNTEAPLRLADQRGKVVLLDFWTYSCINCLHVLPDLHYLEDKYADSLCVIGLHSPKFPNERVAAQVQKAINRHHIRHPIAHDPSFTVWKKYAIRAWPSIIFIDPEGYVVGVLRGEGRRKQLDQLIQQHLDAAEAKGLRAYSPLALGFKPEQTGLLRFPGKILATDHRLYIANSGRNMVLETTHDGRILRTFGTGASGFTDGRGEDVMFNNPQGMAKGEERLYVADTDNHAIRVIDLVTGNVDTLAGTGEQGRHAGQHSDDPKRAQLNSPWDLTLHDGVLYIAMAGQHQIWSLNLNHNTIGVFAGSGREDIVDGPAQNAAFAQPSGITADADSLYVVDAETSSVRAIRIPFHAVSSLVGTGLFDFGDSDGLGKGARLQHPLGLTYDAAREQLWIADTFNHKIKIINVHSKMISSIRLTLPLNEPGGLGVQGNSLWIANTNAHQILHMDIDSGEARVLEIDG